MIHVPVDGQMDPLCKVVFGIITKKPSCLTDIRIGVADISLALGAEDGLHLFSKGVAELMVYVDQILSSPCADIEGLSRRIGGCQKRP